MPSTEENLAQLARLRIAVNAPPIPRMPDYPEDVLKRFPSLRQHQAKVEEWRKKCITILQGN